jgi:hypothetical protein
VKVSSKVSYRIKYSKSDIKTRLEKKQILNLVLLGSLVQGYACITCTGCCQVTLFQQANVCLDLLVLVPYVCPPKRGKSKQIQVVYIWTETKII